MCLLSLLSLIRNRVGSGALTHLHPRDWSGKFKAKNLKSNFTSGQRVPYFTFNTRKLDGDFIEWLRGFVDVNRLRFFLLV